MLKKGCGCNKSTNVTPELPKDWGIPKIDLNPVKPESKPWVCPDILPAVLIINNPDNEDIASVLLGTSEVLKFADKAYNPLTFSGMGRVFLRKNLINDSLSCSSGVNKLELSMFNDKDGQPLTNTIFIVQYEYDLQGSFITIPCNSILLFLGGSFNNGTVILNNTLVLPHMLEYSKYMNCAIKGSFAKGQTFYSDGVIKVWNGSSWNSLDISNYEGILELLDGKADIDHTHNINDIPGLQGALNSKLEYVTVNGTRYTLDQNILISGGGSGDGSGFTLFPATTDDLGGIKIGYTPASNTSNYPVKLDTNQKAYVTVPGFDSSGINLKLSTIENDINGFKRLANIIFDPNNGFQAQITAIKESITDDGGLNLEKIEANLKNYVDSSTLTAVTSALDRYWVTENDIKIKEILSGFDSIAGPNESLADVFAKYVTVDYFNAALIITQANMDYAMVSLLALDNSGTKAAIEAKVLNAVSSISISANEVTLKGGSSYIKLMGIDGTEFNPSDPLNPDMNSMVLMRLLTKQSNIIGNELFYNKEGLLVRKYSLGMVTPQGVKIFHEGKITCTGPNYEVLWQAESGVSGLHLNQTIIIDSGANSGESNGPASVNVFKANSSTFYHSTLYGDKLSFRKGTSTGLLTNLTIGLDDNITGTYRIKVISERNEGEVVKDFEFVGGILCAVTNV